MPRDRGEVRVVVQEGRARPNDRYRDQTVAQAPECLARVAARAVDHPSLLEIGQTLERQDIEAEEPRAQFADRLPRSGSGQKLHEDHLGHRDVLVALDQFSELSRDLVIGGP